MLVLTDVLETDVTDPFSGDLALAFALSLFQPPARDMPKEPSRIRNPRMCTRSARLVADLWSMQSVMSIVIPLSGAAGPPPLLRWPPQGQCLLSASLVSRSSLHSNLIGCRLRTEGGPVGVSWRWGTSHGSRFIPGHPCLLPRPVSVDLDAE